MAVLRMELSSGYVYVSSNIEPSEIEGNSIAWENVNKVTDFVFEKVKEPDAVVRMEAVRINYNGFLVLAAGLFVITKKKVT